MSGSFIVGGKTFTIPDVGDPSKPALLQVHSSPRNYTVAFSRDDSGRSVASELDANPGSALVCDEKVFKLYLENISIDQSRIFRAPATENFKTMDGVLKLVDFFDDLRISKSSLIVVAGGGIIQDVAAFACAMYKRGIDWTFFPTTLLSMCDSCIGAKANVNYRNGKNQLGLFTAPGKVIINPGFLETLSEFDIRSGLGEILKLFIMGGEKYLGIYESFTKEDSEPRIENYLEMIIHALSLKIAVIQEDEFELDSRKILNYGHTIGHAVESLSNYSIPHGQAVALGISVVNDISVEHGMLSAVSRDMIKRLIAGLIGRNPEYGDFDEKKFKDLILRDKKTRGGIVTFAALKKPGEMFLLKIPAGDELFESLIKSLRANI